jgi:transposase-like protein
LTERTFDETRSQVKVIGRLPGEHSCLSLVWAVLERAWAGWRGFAMTPPGSDYWPTCASTCTTH